MITLAINLIEIVKKVPLFLNSYDHLLSGFSMSIRNYSLVKYYGVPNMSFGEGNGTPLQYSCLENPMDGGAWYGVAKSWTRLSDFTFAFPFHALEKEMATHSRFLPGEPQGRGSLVGCRLRGRTESDTTEAT